MSVGPSCREIGRICFLPSSFLFPLSSFFLPSSRVRGLSSFLPRPFFSSFILRSAFAQPSVSLRAAFGQPSGKLRILSIVFPFFFDAFGFKH